MLSGRIGRLLERLRRPQVKENFRDRDRANRDFMPYFSRSLLQRILRGSGGGGGVFWGFIVPVALWGFFLNICVIYAAQVGFQ